MGNSVGSILFIYMRKKKNNKYVWRTKFGLIGRFCLPVPVSLSTRIVIWPTSAGNSRKSSFEDDESRRRRRWRRWRWRRRRRHRHRRWRTTERGTAGAYGNQHVLHGWLLIRCEWAGQAREGRCAPRPPCPLESQVNCFISPLFSASSSIWRANFRKRGILIDYYSCEYAFFFCCWMLMSCISYIF